MAEPDKNPVPTDASPTAAAAPEKPIQPPPPMWLRALLGFAGLSLLVGFFLPWVRIPAVEGSTEVHFQNGMDLVLAADIEGTPSAVVLLIPVLGAILSALSFMGLRYAAQTAVGVAMLLIGYAMYVLGSMFVQNTGYGLWVVAGGTFVILLLGVTWILARRAPHAAKATDAKK